MHVALAAFADPLISSTLVQLLVQFPSSQGSVRNFKCCLSAAAPPGSVSGSLWRLLKHLHWAGRAAEPCWPWHISVMVFAPFGAIFNDKDDRLCLPITGGSKWILSGCHEEAPCSGWLLMHSASAFLAPLLINSSEGLFLLSGFCLQSFKSCQGGRIGSLGVKAKNHRPSQHPARKTPACFPL